MISVIDIWISVMIIPDNKEILYSAMQPALIPYCRNSPAKHYIMLLNNIYPSFLIFQADSTDTSGFYPT